MDPILGIVNILAQEFLGEEVPLVAGCCRVCEDATAPLPHGSVHRDVSCDGVIQVQSPSLVQGFRLHVGARPPVLMGPQNVFGKAAIQRRIELVQHDEKQIETREEGVREADILLGSSAG